MTNRTPRTVRWFVGLATVAIVVQVGAYLFVRYYLDYPRPNTAAEFGDVFGVTNALFSGLAFAAVIVAIVLQRHELKEQRTALDEQRHELSEANRLRVAQGRETSFFALLTFFRTETHSLRLPLATGEHVGLSAFTALLRYLALGLGPSPAFTMEGLHVLQGQYRDHRAPFAGYLAALRQLVVSANRASEQSGYFMEVLRAQLTSDELSVIAIHCLSPEGESLKTLVEENGLLAGWEAPGWLDAYRNGFRASAFQSRSGA